MFTKVVGEHTKTEELFGGKIYHFEQSIVEKGPTDRVYCEHCCSTLMVREIINGSCPNCGAPIRE